MKIIYKSSSQIAYGNNDAELYFEEDDMDSFIQKISKFNIEYVHAGILEKTSAGKS